MVDLDEVLPHRLMTYIEDKQSKRYFMGRKQENETQRTVTRTNRTPRTRIR